MALIVTIGCIYLILMAGPGRADPGMLEIASQSSGIGTHDVSLLMNETLSWPENLTAWGWMVMR